VTGDIDDQENRTSAVGLYHYAISYRRAADALASVKLKATHPDAPREFLYYHSIELFLKAYLRNAGVRVQELKKIGHRFDKLAQMYIAKAGFLMDEDQEVLALMSATDVVPRARYIVTGIVRKPALQALARTAKSLNDTVRVAMKQAGQPVR
jgi:hypothetical protein